MGVAAIEVGVEQVDDETIDVGRLWGAEGQGHRTGVVTNDLEQLTAQPHDARAPVGEQPLDEPVVAAFEARPVEGPAGEREIGQHVVSR